MAMGGQMVAVNSSIYVIRCKSEVGGTGDGLKGRVGGEWMLYGLGWPECPIFIGGGASIYVIRWPLEVGGTCGGAFRGRGGLFVAFPLCFPLWLCAKPQREPFRLTINIYREPEPAAVITAHISIRAIGTRVFKIINNWLTRSRINIIIIAHFRATTTTYGEQRQLDNHN